MDDQSPARDEPPELAERTTARRVPQPGGAVVVCRNVKVGYISPYDEWHNADQLRSVPELPEGLGELIDPDDADPGLSGIHTLMREDEEPLPDRAPWHHIGPPMHLQPCDPEQQECDGHD